MTEPRPRDRVATHGPPDPRDLVGDFGHRHVSVVRFADTDAMGHVNNAVYLTFVESARVAWWSDVTGEAIQREPGRAEGLILAEAEVAFRAPVFHGETVVVETRATRIGRTSIASEHRLTASRPGGPARLVATCRSVIVRYDYVTETPVALDPDLIERIETAEGRPLRG
ncbi:MAG TPA: thioesterase family protein [Patescibacteria group bacterium]|nr:thioesterase family protein [Patescibacteria group bacterium]